MKKLILLAVLLPSLVFAEDMFTPSNFEECLPLYEYRTDQVREYSILAGRYKIFFEFYKQKSNDQEQTIIYKTRLIKRLRKQIKQARNSQ